MEFLWCLYCCIDTLVFSNVYFLIIRTCVFDPLTMLFTHTNLQVLSEAVDLEKSHDMVYGIRAGGPLDEEILRYMRARGWSERIQVRKKSVSVFLNGG